jgi:hypothetical protein
MLKLFVSMFIVCIVSAAQASYNARLDFRNPAFGAAMPGALVVRPGDTVEVWYTFHKNDTVNPYKWGTLQVTLCLDGLTMVSAADQASWNAAITTAKSSGGPASDFLSTVIGNGPLHGNPIDPTDPSAPLVCNNGVYMLLGINEARARAADWEVKLWLFTVQPVSAGQKLDWFIDPFNGEQGLNTRILDQKGQSLHPTDNWVIVVPEPSVVGGFGVLCSLLALRRRR